MKLLVRSEDLFRPDASPRAHWYSIPLPTTRMTKEMKKMEIKNCWIKLTKEGKRKENPLPKSLYILCENAAPVFITNKRSLPIAARFALRIFKEDEDDDDDDDNGGNYIPCDPSEMEIDLMPPAGNIDNVLKLQFLSGISNGGDPFPMHLVTFSFFIELKNE